MKLESIFYIVGAIFAIAAIIYFAFEYLIHLAKTIKVILLILVTITLYFSAKEMQRRNM